jgi:hypothetical protein
MKVSSILTCFRKKQNRIVPQIQLNINEEVKENKSKTIINNWVNDIELERNDNECTICLEDNDKLDLILPCMHKFHKECIQKWVDSSNNKHCPLCRNPFDINLIKEDDKVKYNTRSQPVEPLQDILYFTRNLINMPIAPVNTPPRIARFRRINRNISS